MAAWMGHIGGGHGDVAADDGHREEELLLCTSPNEFVVTKLILFCVHFSVCAGLEIFVDILQNTRYFGILPVLALLF